MRRRGLLAAALLLAAAGPEEPGLMVGREGGPARLLPEAALAALPAQRVSAPADHGTAERVYEGPSLWAVLEAAGLADRPRDQVRQAVLATGRDGYVAVLAMGEVSPEFAGRAAIVALRQDGVALAPAQWRLVLPGEKRGGRTVRELAGLSVATLR
ncbi:hypothetical protein [Belnapia sp. F-4-1]|uniref:hypothetical protein n=1 Tax=Belnapia sp. F-4-1 TaxID=1545443 RepID=UPI00068B51CA|nr:hypothetical protein [Belnapia sp. F-4-1]